LSEGLYYPAQGVTPSYYWDGKGRKKSAPRKAFVCRECGGTKAFSTWTRSLEDPRMMERKLVCANCKQRTVFLQNHVRVVR